MTRVGSDESYSKGSLLRHDPERDKEMAGPNGNAPSNSEAVNAVGTEVTVSIEITSLYWLEL